MDGGVVVSKILFSIPCSDIPTLNCFELTYENDQKYRLSVETIYEFDSIKNEYNYYCGILELFSDWMKEQGYLTSTLIAPSDIFYQLHDDYGVYFDSIQDAFAWFRFNVKAYLNLLHDPEYYRI